MSAVRTSDAPNTPTFGGYVLTLVVALVVFSVGVEVVTGLSEYSGEIIFFGVLVGLVVCSPLALVVVPLVHLAVRRIESQWFHVVVAAATGAVGSAVVWVYLVDGNLALREVTLAAFGGAVAAGVGRAATIPLVLRRRRPGYVPILERVHTLI